MMIRTNAAANRKDLVKAMSDILNEKPRYCFAPSFAYEFGREALKREIQISK